MLLCLGGTRKRMLEGPRLCSFFYLIYNHNTSPGFGKNNGRLLHTTYYHETSTVDGEVGLLSYLKMLANLPSPQWESECAKSFEKNRGIEVRSINSKVNFRIVIIRNQSRELRIVCLLSIQPMEKQNESIWEFLEQNYFGYYYYYIRGEKEAKKVKLQSPYWLTLV